MPIEKVGIAGCGLMGAGIAQVAAQNGFSTVVREVDRGLVERGLAHIESFLAKGVDRGKITADEKKATLGRLRGTMDLADLADCDIVIEAIVENREAKLDLFKELDRICKKSAIFASNTSSLSITEMAAGTGRPERFVGLHFFNPVPLMPLLEVVRTLMLIRAAGDDTDLIDVPAAARADYVELSRRFELSHYVQMIAMLEELRRSVRFSGAGRALTDALMVRFARMHKWSSIEQLLAGLSSDNGASDEKKKSPPPLVAAEPGRCRIAPPPAESPPPIRSQDAAAPPISVTPRASEPVSSDETARIKNDPLVRQVMDLFDGTVSNIERMKDKPPAPSRES